MLVPGSAQARTMSLVISRTESPTFDGMSFGQVGPYEKLVGRATGEVDPNYSKNALIVDINLAPRNSRGMVEYPMLFVHPAPGRPHARQPSIVLDVNNRGELMCLAQLNGAPAPTTTRRLRPTPATAI